MKYIIISLMMIISLSSFSRNSYQEALDNYLLNRKELGTSRSTYREIEELETCESIIKWNRKIDIITKCIEIENYLKLNKYKEFSTFYINDSDNCINCSSYINDYMCIISIYNDRIESIYFKLIDNIK